ncbi:uncharacterized protein [Canis lupus baileyi]|uniref:uncharacterized protein LOC112652896 isoform X1 n=1 Tax=Canis lupus dingo TaxID=286419 RepID=UPI000DC68DE7|nr:uncharacterized protein LOC112652896 isoform X1 [Canis lupus dingo]
MGMNFSEKEINDLIHDLPVDGKNVHVSDLKKVLGSLRIELTDEELKKLQENLPIDAAGNVSQNKMLDDVKSIKGGIVDIAELDTALQNMGIKLTGMESNHLLKNLPVDAAGKVYQNTLLDGVKSIKAYGRIIMKTLFDGLKASAGRKINVQYLPDFVSNICIELPDKEQKRLLNKLPVDASGKIFQDRLLDGLKSFKGSSLSLCCIRDVQSNGRVRRVFSGEGGHCGFGTCTDLSMPHGRKTWHRSYTTGILLMRMRFSTRNQERKVMRQQRSLRLQIQLLKTWVRRATVNSELRMSSSSSDLVLPQAV